jgi:cytochrome c biogenesis protein CcmG/thiol:disulfide interchange protein DsbE
VQITKLDGGAFKLSDFRGKVLVVDFWATYCPPCVRQVPRLAELSKKYRDKGLEVVGLTSDDKADQEKVVEFLKKSGADYIVGYDNQWLSSAFLKGTEDDTGQPPIPQLFVISREGRIVDHFIGENPRRGIEDVEQVVSQQLSSR